ncbi:MAG: alpha/beta hydrolase [Solirubrobacteraceae bacterium]|nr:alpha/beta hydrolase [Patulibacter sp.]
MSDTQTTLALIHGLGGSRRCWDLITPALVAAGLRPEPVELPGYGENRRRATPRTIEEMAEAASDAIGRLRGERIVVVGHSMGGLVATAIAERAASLAERIVLVNSSLTVASRLTAHKGSEGLIRKPVIGRIAWRVAPRAKLKSGLRSAFAPSFPVPDSFVDDLRACSWSTFTRSSAAMDLYLGERSLPERLDALDTPASLIYGMQDLRVDHDAIDAICAERPGTVTRIDDAGHSPMWETPQVAAAAIARAVGAPAEPAAA